MSEDLLAEQRKQEAVARAQRAKELLDNELHKHTLREIETAIVEALKETNLVGEQGIDQAYELLRTLQAQHRYKTYLERTVTLGEHIAKQEAIKESESIRPIRDPRFTH